MSQNCSDCYNGCSAIVSDKCVKYTGVDVPLLDIRTGDSLSFVEQAIITFLGSVLDGSGIKITLDEEVYCELVSQYLQECQEVTALDLFKALVQSACNLQEQVDAIVADIATIEADYTINCLEGVVASSGTHAIVQAVITKLCEVDATLTALATDVDTNYVKIADINNYIAAYLADQAPATRYYTRMLPFGVVLYAGSLSFFDATGAGLPNTEWEQIYICNGSNSTPDMRGRVPVGVITGVPGGAMSPTVNPASDPTFNPAYSLGDVAGVNKITLATTQIPAHSHSVTDPGHTHVLAKNEDVGGSPLIADEYLASIRDVSTDGDYNLQNATDVADVGKVLENVTGISIDNSGGGQAHDNKQPALAFHFVMYIPT